MTRAIWSSVIISEGMGDIGFVGESNWGVKKGIGNFSAIEGGGVHLGDESMAMFFSLSFLKILRCQWVLKGGIGRAKCRVSIMVNLGLWKR